MKKVKEEAAAEAVESGSSPLDESLALFEEGVGLVKLCNARLDTAEQKVKLLIPNPDGTAEERDMPPMT